jgi:hypothetical protein
MQFFGEHGMTPILDPLHHTSFPDWLENGFANPNFPSLYARFIGAVRRRYPWANHYTLFNEPLPTTLFCSHSGMWYPYRRSDREFVRMAVDVARAICLAFDAVLKEGPAVFVHIDSCEHHTAAGSDALEQAQFCNERRYLMHELMLGSVDKAHPLFGYLSQNGFSDSDRLWLQDHPARIDVLGVDYYPHSELEWYHDKRHSTKNYRLPRHALGFAEIARQYINRFRRPVILSETNIRGTVADRLTWLKYMTEQCDELAETCDFRGFCWYPSIDSTDWCHCCTKCTLSVDPQGIWWLDDRRWERHESELSEIYSDLANHRRPSSELPAYELTWDAERLLRGYARHMDRWPVWKPVADEAERAA